MTNPAGLLVTPIGFDVSGNVLPLLLGPDGSVLVAGPSPSTLSPINEATAFSNTSLPAGTSVQTAITVPANQIFRVTCFEMHYTGTVAGVTLRGRVNTGLASMAFLYVPVVASDTPYVQVVNFLLSAAWKIEVVVVGATLNDDLFANTFCERIA